MDPRLAQIEAEMARFEHEISAPRMARPPMPMPPTPNMALSFVPHAMQRGPMVLGPPMLVRPHMMPPPPPFGYQPPPPRPPPAPMPSSSGMVGRASSAVIEGAPTRYLAPGASSSAASSTSASRYGVEDLPPSKMMSQALPSDVELIAAKRQQEAAYHNSYIGQVLSGKKKAKRFIRVAGGQKWEDASLAEWDINDFRLFAGDLGNEVSDEVLAKPFRRYESFQKAKVVRDKRTNKSKGYGFVSFKDPQDYVRAMREMDGKYVGNRPIKLRKSTWKERDMTTVKKKVKEKKKLGMKI